jgi:hypothetical protein
VTVISLVTDLANQAVQLVMAGALAALMVQEVSDTIRLSAVLD